MATFMILAVLALAMVTYVWFRQARHKDTAGRPLNPEVLLEKQGRFWGTSNGGGF